MPDSSADLTIASNAIGTALERTASEALHSIRHVSIVSTPGDDLAEEDFIPRVQQVVTAMPILEHLTLTIPTMARLHPSSSLPKVITVFQALSDHQPKLRFSLTVRADLGQVFSSGPLLRRMAQDAPAVDNLSLTGTNLLIEDLASAVAACGIFDLSFDNCQITSPEPSDATGFTTLRRLMLSIARNSDEKTVMGHQALLRASQVQLRYLKLVSCGPDFVDASATFPCLETLDVGEDLLQAISDQSMPLLRVLSIQSLKTPSNVNHLRGMLEAEWCRIDSVNIATLPVGQKCEDLVALRKNFPNVNFRIREYLAEPTSISLDVLEIAESLCSYGAPSDAAWPVPEITVQCPHLRTVTLKVIEGSNYEEFLAKLNMPHLDGPPKVTVAKRKQPKMKKSRA